MRQAMMRMWLLMGVGWSLLVWYEVSVPGFTGRGGGFVWSFVLSRSYFDV